MLLIDQYNNLDGWLKLVEKIDIKEKNEVNRWFILVDGEKKYTVQPCGSVSEYEGNGFHKATFKEIFQATEYFKKAQRYSAATLHAVEDRVELMAKKAKKETDNSIWLALKQQSSNFFEGNGRVVDADLFVKERRFNFEQCKAALAKLASWDTATEHEQNECREALKTLTPANIRKWVGPDVDIFCLNDPLRNYGRAQNGLYEMCQNIRHVKLIEELKNHFGEVPKDLSRKLEKKDNLRWTEKRLSALDPKNDINITRATILSIYKDRSVRFPVEISTVIKERYQKYPIYPHKVCKILSLASEHLDSEQSYALWSSCIVREDFDHAIAGSVWKSPEVLQAFGQRICEVDYANSSPGNTKYFFSSEQRAKMFSWLRHTLGRPNPSEFYRRFCRFYEKWLEIFAEQDIFGLLKLVYWDKNDSPNGQFSLFEAEVREMLRLDPKPRQLLINGYIKMNLEEEPRLSKKRDMVIEYLKYAEEIIEAEKLIVEDQQLIARDMYGLLFAPIGFLLEKRFKIDHELRPAVAKFYADLKDAVQKNPYLAKKIDMIIDLLTPFAWYDNNPTAQQDIFTIRTRYRELVELKYIEKKLPDFVLDERPYLAEFYKEMDNIDAGSPLQALDKYGLLKLPMEKLEEELKKVDEANKKLISEYYSGLNYQENPYFIIKKNKIRNVLTPFAWMSSPKKA